MIHLISKLIFPKFDDFNYLTTQYLFSYSPLASSRHNLGAKFTFSVKACMRNKIADIVLLMVS